VGFVRRADEGGAEASDDLADRQGVQPLGAGEGQLLAERGLVRVEGAGGAEVA